MIKKEHFLPCLCWFLLSVIIYSQGLSIHGVEYRDDEIFYFNSTQEMVQKSDYLSPAYFGEDRFQKPILYYWFIIISYKIFGLNWFAARFPSVVCAGISVCLIWLMSRRLFDNKHLAHLSALILMTAPLFFRHAKNAVPDMALTMGIILTCYLMLCFKDGIDQGANKATMARMSHAIFVSCAFGFMIKGIAAFAVPFGMWTLYSLAVKKCAYLKQLHWRKGVGLFLLICMPWFLYMTLRHGTSYLDYMIGFETQTRILGAEQTGGFLMARLTQFGRNALFYLGVLFKYFAPWSLFVLLGVPLGVGRILKNHKDRDTLMFLFIWMGVVFTLFSFMDFKISHYMLSLAAPFVILLSYVLNDALSLRTRVGQVVRFLKQYYIISMLLICAFAYCLLTVLLLQWNPWFIVLIVIAVVYGVFLIMTEKSIPLPAYILAGVILFIQLQSPLLAKASLTPHTSLQKFAKVVHAYKDTNFAVGVGSHDLHEKEFQVYFNQPVEK
ncbi:MAG: 4-amino-4-deoxy-L-arabinose transferase-like glycosyltransferase, partial [Lysobacterales bacterium]